ncbi:MAG: PEP-utilizing enzyme [Patescibacteria group bacterium]
MTESEIAKYIITNKDAYEVMASRPFTVQRVGIVGTFCRHTLGISSLCVPLPDGKDSIYIEKNAHKKYKSFINKLLQGDNFKKHLANYKTLGKKLLESSRKAKHVKLDRKSLLTCYKSWDKNLTAFSVYFISPYIIEDDLYHRFASKVKNVDLIAGISGPTQLFGYQKFQLELLAMGEKINYDKLVKKYAWLNEYSLKEKLMDKSDVNKRKKEITKRDLKKAILSYRSTISENKHHYQEAIKKLDGKDKLMAEIIHEYVNIRTDRIEIYNQGLTAMRSFFKRLALLVQKEFPWFSYYDAVNLTNQEIIAYLEKGILPTQELLEKRINRKTIIFSPASKKGVHEFFIYKPELVKKVIAKYLEVESAVKEIKGVAVSSGLARGRVRLIMGAQDFKKFKTGEILVAHYTSPSFMMVMKKAAAIITNEGGITSHAAIVSRELKKPCVVGAKIATKVLHNGDMVEVDADKGIIKRVK